MMVFLETGSWWIEQKVLILIIHRDENNSPILKRDCFFLFFLKKIFVEYFEEK
jgi:hypothetical protein